jgi:Fic family protein
MQKRLIISIGAAAKALGVTVPTITAALQNLAEIGIVSEMTGHKRNRVFSYTKYLAIVSAGTEPIR